MRRTLPTHDEVLAAIKAHEPCTARDLLTALDLEWVVRGTLHNRLSDLVATGQVITDEGRPKRYAINPAVQPQPLQLVRVMMDPETANAVVDACSHWLLTTSAGEGDGDRERMMRKRVQVRGVMDAVHRAIPEETQT